MNKKSKTNPIIPRLESKETLSSSGIEVKTACFKRLGVKHPAEVKAICVSSHTIGGWVLVASMKYKGIEIVDLVTEESDFNIMEMRSYKDAEAIFSNKDHSNLEGFEIDVDEPKLMCESRRLTVFTYESCTDRISANYLALKLWFEGYEDVPVYMAVLVSYTINDLTLYENDGAIFYEIEKIIQDPIVEDYRYGGNHYTLDDKRLYSIDFIDLRKSEKTKERIENSSMQVHVSWINMIKNRIPSAQSKSNILTAELQR